LYVNKYVIYLGNLGGLFVGCAGDTVKQNGAGVLNHILGSKQKGVEGVICHKAVLDSGFTVNILKVTAPILMGFLVKTGVKFREP
jgi:hypothetical protein